jgi:CIC family chloride channel protein
MRHLRRLLDATSIRLRQAGYLRKWLILGAVIGIVAGLGAIAFTIALRWATSFFLGVVGGYTPPAPIGEGATLGSGSHFARPWAIPLVVGLGGLISGILVFALAPEAEGHGTDAAIDAVHHNPRGIRGRVSFVKIIASAITIGSGGSAGREGPTAQISAGFGSMLARWLDLTPRDARIAVTVGIGSGIGAIFRAPLGGAILGAEVLYREDVEADALIPSLVASIIGFAVFGGVNGFTPIFGASDAYHFTHPAELAYYAIIGIAAGLIGRLYAANFYRVVHLTHRLPGNRMWKPALGGLLVGIMALAIPQVLGTGYGWVQVAMGAGLMTLPLWIVLALPFAKILATSLSIGSGGSGGIFGPGMVIGGFLGGAVWRVASGLPAVPHDPAPFVVVGMIACSGSIAHAPLSVMLMVAEMTGTLEMLAPAMVAVGIASAVVGDATIYTSQIKNRTQSPSHRFRFGLPLIASIPVAEAMRPPRLVLEGDTPVRDALGLLTALALPGAPVTDAEGIFRGSVETSSVEASDPAERVASRVDRTVPAVPEDATLDAVVEVFASDHVAWVAVLDRSRRVVGVVGTADLVDAYRRSLVSSLSSLRSIFVGSVFVEAAVDEQAAIAEASIADARWPIGVVIVAIQRGNQLIFPEPDTTIEVGDVLSMLVPAGSEARARMLLGASAEDVGTPDDSPMI